MARKRMAEHTRNYGLIVAAIVIAIALLLGLFHTIQVHANRAQAMQSASILIDQVEGLIDTNEEKTDTLIASLKDDYVTRAKTIAYILDVEPETAQDLDELNKIANLMSVDEIHLFDDTGRIIGGTVPKYYGYDLDSGDQISFFKPMLNDHSLSMCQDVTPNTAEGKSMMYAMCWDEAGGRMVQVGIEPVHLLKELNASEASEIVAQLPTYESVTILVANRETHEIQGATDSKLTGKTLESEGIIIDSANLQQGVHEFEATVDGAPSYCAVHEHGSNIFIVATSKALVDQGIPRTLVMVLLYLLLAALVISFIVRKLTGDIVEQRHRATVDPMTGFLNRRGYEALLAEYHDKQLEPNLVYVSFDLNGLKEVNDTYGHDRGDQLIYGCADCMRTCFSSYGTLIRLGGDEFTGLLFTDARELQQAIDRFNQEAERWGRENDLSLSVAIGTAAACDYPTSTIRELAVISDAKMYEAKKRYYEKSGFDRRAR